MKHHHMFALALATSALLIGCGKGSDNSVGASSAAAGAADGGDGGESGDGGDGGGTCVIPVGADTYDAGAGGAASGCRVLPNGVRTDVNGVEGANQCGDHEYGLACAGGSGVELAEPAAALRCHGPQGQPPPGGTVYHCCPCE
jgi:hypothetical protein